MLLIYYICYLKQIYSIGCYLILKNLQKLPIRRQGRICFQVYIDSKATILLVTLWLKGCFWLTIFKVDVPAKHYYEFLDWFSHVWEFAIHFLTHFLIINYMQLPSHLNPLHAAGLIIRPLKTEDQKFSDVFRGYKKRPTAWNELRAFTWYALKYMKLILPA